MDVGCGKGVRTGSEKTTISGAATHLGNNLFSESILLGVPSRLGHAQTSQGRFPWKQRVRALCGGVVGGGWF